MRKRENIKHRNLYTGGKVIGRPIKDYNPEYIRQRLSPRSSLRSSVSDFTDTTISTWNQRHQLSQRHQLPTEYPSVLSDRTKTIDRLPFPRRIDFDMSDLIREPSTSFADSAYKSSIIQDRMEFLSDQLIKVLSTGAGKTHIYNGSLADSGIQTDNTNTSVPQIYIAESNTQVVSVSKILKDASVDTRNENNYQEIPFIDEDDDDRWRRRTKISKHKSMTNIPQRIDEINSKEHSNERLSSSLNRAKSPTFVEKFKKFFVDIGLVKVESTPISPIRETNTLPKNLNSSFELEIEPRDASTLPKDMRFRKVRSTQTVYIKPDSPLTVRNNTEMRVNEHVSVIQLNGEEQISDSKSETLITKVDYVNNIGNAEIYTTKDSGSTIIKVPAD